MFLLTTLAMATFLQSPQDAPEARLRADSLVVKLRGYNKTIKHTKIWCGLLRDLADLGPAAVPRIRREFEQTKSRRMMQRLCFVLRAIDDPSAVPTLIRALPKTLMPPDSDYGLAVDDADLLLFMQTHSWDGDREEKLFSFGQVQREVQTTLAKLTKRELPDARIMRMNLSKDRRAQALQKKYFHEVAMDWAKWWEPNSHRFSLSDPRDAKVSLRPYTPVDTSSLPTGRELPSGAHVSRIREGITLSPVEGTPRKRTHFFDLDTATKLDLLAKSSRPLTRKTAPAWANQHGADILCVLEKQKDGQSRPVLLSAGKSEFWQITPAEARAFPKLVAAKKLPTGTKNIGSLTRFTASGERPARTSFLYLTKDHGIGMITVYGNKFTYYAIAR